MTMDNNNNNTTKDEKENRSKKLHAKKIFKIKIDHERFDDFECPIL